jgi:hypothetical protein
MARRSRRISSSLLPENIGPQIASIHPRLPATKSIDKFWMISHGRERATPHLIMGEWRLQNNE